MYPKPKDGVGLKTIAVDIDGTLAEPTWPSPELGAPIREVVDAAAEAYIDGFEIIAHTARPISHVPAIRGWLQSHGLNFVYDIVTGKPRAAAYWDDRAVTYPEGFSPRQPIYQVNVANGVPSYARWQHGGAGHWHEHTLAPGQQRPDHDH